MVALLFRATIRIVSLGDTTALSEEEEMVTLGSLEPREVFAALIALTAACVASPCLAQSNCDGSWRIGIVVDAGSFDRCTPEQSHRVVVRNGVVTLARPTTSYTFQGSVDAACRHVRFWISRGEETAEGDGTISENTARGQWKVTYPTNRRCSGVWQAAKR
jgi:hypothetical protein